MPWEAVRALAEERVPSISRADMPASTRLSLTAASQKFISTQGPTNEEMQYRT